MDLIHSVDLKEVSKKDGKLHQNKEGSFGVTDNYFDFKSFTKSKRKLEPFISYKKI